VHAHRVDVAALVRARRTLAMANNIVEAQKVRRATRSTPSRERTRRRARVVDARMI